MSNMQSIMKTSGGRHQYIRFFLSLVASSTFSIIMIVMLMGGLLACGENSSSSSSSSSGSTIRKGSIEGLAALRKVSTEVVLGDAKIGLRWETPSEASHVIIKAVSDTETMQVSIPSIVYKTLFRKNKYYYLKGLKKSTTYKVSLKARLGNRVSSQVVRTLFIEEDDTPPKDTLEQVSVAKTGSGIKVTWDKESVEEGKTDISEATIYIKDKVTNKVIKEVAVEDITKGAVNVDTLPIEEGKVYDIEAIYTDRNGNKSDIKKLLSNIESSKLLEEVEGIDEKNFSVEAKNKEGKKADESLLIKWGDFVYTDGKQVSVQVKEIATKVVFLDTKINNESSDIVSSAEEQNNDYVSWYAAKDGLAVTKLYGTQKYSISIRVYDNGRYSPAVEETIVTTDKTTEPVKKLSVVAKETSIVVIWQAPAVRDYAGVEITVTEKVTGKKNEPAVIKDSNIKEKEITGLIIGKTYNISVQSVDKAGNRGKAIDEDIPLEKDTTSPEAVSSITASYGAVLSNNKVATTIRWKAPDSSKAENQDIKVYKLSITKDVDSKVLSDEEIAYPLTEYYTEILEQSTMYTVSILSEDYAGNPSVKVPETITTPSPPEVSKADRPEIVLDTNGEIQVKVSFSTAPGAGVHYKIRMYEEENFIKEKSITKSETTLSFGIADGLEVPREQENAKKYGFQLIKVKNGIASPSTDLTPTEDDKVAVYDSISTAPPKPKTAKMLFAGDVNAEQARARYEFTVGDFTEQVGGSAKYKAPDGSQLEKDEVIYKVYIVEGAESKAEDIKSKAIQVLIVTGARNIDTHSVAFAGKKDATYTAVVEAINTLNPSSYTHVLGGSETIKTITLSTPTTLPKTSTFADSDAVVYTVPESGANTGKNVLRVRVKKTDISGIQKATKEPLIDSDLAYYVIYAKAEDFTSKPTDVESLWTGQKEAKRIAKYEKVAGRNTAIIDIDIVDSTSESGSGDTPIEKAKDYYVGVRVVNTETEEYEANDRNKLFIEDYFIDIAEIKEIRTSNAVAPAQPLLDTILSVERSTDTTGAIQLELRELRDFTDAKKQDGTEVTQNSQLIYTVYGLQQDIDPSVAEVVRAGRKVELGLVRGGKYSVAALTKLGLTSETESQIDIQGEGKKYHFVVEIAIASDTSTKVVSTTVASVETSLATAPAEVGNIRLDSRTTTSATVLWNAPVLSTSHKTKTGADLNQAQVSYKVYKLAKRDIGRGVDQIKTADSSPQTVGVGITTLELTGLTEDTSYELVVQAVNDTDDTQESEGVRYEFKTLESFVAPGTPSIEAEAIRNAIDISIRAPEKKGTAADGTTALRDDQISYIVYYYVSEEDIDAAEVKASAGTETNPKVGGKQDLATETKSHRITGLDYEKIYYITVEAVNSLKEDKKSSLTKVEKVPIGSGATAPAEVSNIRLNSIKTTSATVLWNAPVLSTSHKTKTGVDLNQAQVSYKVYKLAKSGNLERTVDQIKTADSSPQTVGVGITTLELTGLTEDTSYELVVQAVNNTDETKESEGVRYEFKTLESFVAPGTPSIEAEAIGNAIELSIRAPRNKGTAEDGTTALRDDQISYIVYYYVSEGDIDAAQVKARAETEKNEKVGGKQVATGITSHRITGLDYMGTKVRERFSGITSHRITGLDYEKKYYITVEAVNSLKEDKKSSLTKVERVPISSGATAPAEVGNIRLDSRTTSAIVVWDAPTLDENHKTKTGANLKTTEVSYKVYKLAKSGDTERTVDQIKTADSSPRTVGAGRTTLELTGLTEDTSYELVVQAVNNTDEKKESGGVRYEFKTLESFAAPGTPSIEEAEAIGNTIELSIGVPDNKGTARDGTTALRDNQIKYIVYYYVSEEDIDAAEVKARAEVEAETNPKVGGKQDLATGRTSHRITGLDYEKTYYITVEAVNSLKEDKKSSLTKVERVPISSGATAPAEVGNIRLGSRTKTSATVLWNAPTLDENHKTVKGENLIAAQVSYKVYKLAKSGSIERTVNQIKTADSSPRTVAAGTTTLILTGLTEDTSYELVVQAVNDTDDTQESEGVRYEFKTLESFVAPGTPSIEAEAIGNAIELSIRAPRKKGTAEDGTTALIDDQIKYIVYYYASEEDIDAAEVKASAGTETNPKVGGKQDLATGRTSHRITGLDYEKTYYITVEAVNSLERNKKSLPTTVESVKIGSGATAPAEVGNIRLDSRKTTSVTVLWNAPILDENHKTVKGENLIAAQVSYKVYKVAKSGNLERTVDQIKTADSSPRTVAAGTTRFELTGLTEDTSYELVVQAVNDTDDTQESEGVRYEFKTLESFVAPGTPSIEAEAIGNAIELSIRAPRKKGTAEDGTTALRDNQISYIVYYYVSEEDIDAAQVKARAEAETNPKVGGKQDLATGTTSHRITGLDYEKTYYITVEAVNSLERNKKSLPTKVSVEIGSGATAPAEVGNIRLGSRTKTSATVLWNAPTLDKSHKTRTGEQLKTAEVSYKVYKLAKSGDIERTVNQIKTADSSPQTVGVGTTRFELTGLTEDTSYELVVQAVNGTDDTQESEGVRYEFKTLESFVAPGTPDIEKVEAIGNAIELSIRAPRNKGTAEDGTTALRDDQIEYIVYYYASEGAIDAAEVKASAGTEKNANVGGKQETATGTTIHRITGLDYEKTYYITVEAVNSLDTNKKSSPTTVVKSDTPSSLSFIFKAIPPISATVGTPISEIVLMTEPEEATLSCDADDSFRDKVKRETGLTFDKKTMRIIGNPNKSNVHDDTITEYTYELTCTGIGEYAGTEKVTISIRTELEAVGGETADYYRPITRDELFSIIEEEIGRQSTKSPYLNMIDTSAIEDMESLFSSLIVDENKGTVFSNKEFNGDITNWNTSKVKNMVSMFSSASKFNQDIGDWDVSKVTNMNYMFNGALEFNQDIGDWDVGEVTSMNYMFYVARIFNQDIGDWDVSKVTSMKAMFQYAYEFNQDIGDWKVDKVTNMNSMFHTASSFNQDIGDWDVGEVTSMNAMFHTASSFNQDIGDWDVSKVTDMGNLFRGSIIDQDLSSWKACKVSRDVREEMWKDSPMEFEYARYPKFQGSSECSSL